MALALVECEPEFVGFALEDTPAEPVPFVAGDSGRVVVQFTDVRGADLALEGTAFLAVLRELNRDLPAHLRSRWGAWTRLHAGRAVFAHVGLDLPLQLSVHPEDREGVWREIEGPRAPGEEVLVRVAVGPPAPVARGLVQGVGRTFSDAVPRGARLRALAPHGAQAFARWIEEDGAFECPLWREFSPDELAGTWTLELCGSGGPLLTLGVTPTLDEQDGALDFGNLTFAPPSDLVRVCVLGGGRPTDDAMVEVEGSPSWIWCAEGGRCALNGSPRSLPISIRGTHRDWLPSVWTEVREAGSEHTLELRAGGALEGRVLLQAGGSPDDFELALWFESAPEEPEQAELLEDGRFRFGPCEPGRATLVISYGDVAVHEQAGVELHAGETTELGTLDLRGAPRALPHRHREVDALPQPRPR
ncbi:MAG: carboxypeptidase-like regulatory domain-containing protein, partial [Myxococcaceae bacterium]|nr:carboxypeptidase-like regulatory domain-containing protein [Myxococcaceae bacterium]